MTSALTLFVSFSNTRVVAKQLWFFISKGFNCFGIFAEVNKVNQSVFTKFSAQYLQIRQLFDMERTRWPRNLQQQVLFGLKRLILQIIKLFA